MHGWKRKRRHARGIDFISACEERKHIEQRYTHSCRCHDGIAFLCFVHFFSQVRMYYMSDRSTACYPPPPFILHLSLSLSRFSLCACVCTCIPIFYTLSDDADKKPVREPVSKLRFLTDLPFYFYFFL